MIDRIDRLPKWARDKIWLLEKKLSGAESERDELRSKAFNGDGSVGMLNWDFGKNTVLPNRAIIRFKFDEQNIDVRKDGDAVYISSCPYGMTVFPTAANAIYIKVGRR